MDRARENNTHTNCAIREITQQLCLLNALREILKKDERLPSAHHFNECSAKLDAISQKRKGEKEGKNNETKRKSRIVNAWNVS